MINGRKKSKYFLVLFFTFVLFLPKVSASTMRWIMEGAVVHQASQRITCGYLCYVNHYAVDIGHRGTYDQDRVYALASGTVTVAVDGKSQNLGSSGLASYGNYIEINHGDGLVTRYAHLEKGTLTVTKGTVISGGRHAIAVMGQSGNANGKHLHFEVIFNGIKVNPIPYLSWAP